MVYMYVDTPKEKMIDLQTVKTLIRSHILRHALFASYPFRGLQWVIP